MALLLWGEGGREGGREGESLGFYLCHDHMCLTSRCVDVPTLVCSVWTVAD